MSKSNLFFKTLIIFAMVFGVNAQTSKTEKEQKEIQKKEREKLEPILKAYTFCTFNDGLQISRVDRITKNKPEELGRPVAKEEYRGVSRTDSYRVMVDYKQPDYFANVRPDRSKPEKYLQDKEVLRQWIKYLGTLAAPTNPNILSKNTINNFEIYSVNREKIEGDQLGATVFFDDKNSIVVSVYFLNQRPKFRNFQTIEEWKVLRDEFLITYTSCVRQNLDNL